MTTERRSVGLPGVVICSRTRRGRLIGVSTLAVTVVTLRRVRRSLVVFPADDQRIIFDITTTERSSGLPGVVIDGTTRGCHIGISTIPVTVVTLRRGRRFLLVFPADDQRITFDMTTTERSSELLPVVIPGTTRGRLIGISTLAVTAVTFRRVRHSLLVSPDKHLRSGFPSSFGKDDVAVDGERALAQLLPQVVMLGTRLGCLIGTSTLAVTVVTLRRGRRSLVIFPADDQRITFDMITTERSSGFPGVVIPGTTRGRLIGISTLAVTAVTFRRVRHSLLVSPDKHLRSGFPSSFGKDDVAVDGERALAQLLPQVAMPGTRRGCLSGTSTLPVTVTLRRVRRSLVVFPADDQHITFDMITTERSSGLLPVAMPGTRRGCLSGTSTIPLTAVTLRRGLRSLLVSPATILLLRRDITSRCRPPSSGSKHDVAVDGERAVQHGHDAEVERESAQDEEGAGEAELLEQDTQEGRQEEGAGPHPRRGQPHPQPAAPVEVQAHGDEARRVGQPSAHAWRSREAKFLFVCFIA